MSSSVESDNAVEVDPNNQVWAYLMFLFNHFGFMSFISKIILENVNNKSFMKKEEAKCLIFGRKRV